MAKAAMVLLLFVILVRMNFFMPDQNLCKRVFICLFITGAYKKGFPNMKTAPERIPGINFDSVVDCVVSPSRDSSVLPR